MSPILTLLKHWNPVALTVARAILTQRHSISTVAAIALVAFGFGSAVVVVIAAPQSRWEGHYLPERSLCEGLELTLQFNVVTYGTCRRTRIKRLRETDSELSFEIDGHAPCNFSGAVLVLRGAGRRVLMEKYDDLRLYQSATPSYYCPYEMKTPQPSR